jgi:predicted transcriptional regulator
MTAISLQLGPELDKALGSLSAENGKSIDVLIRQAVTEYVARHREQEKRRTQTLAAIASVERGCVVDEEKVDAWLESWGTDQELPPPSP